MIDKPDFKSNDSIQKPITYAFVIFGLFGMAAGILPFIGLKYDDGNCVSKWFAVFIPIGITLLNLSRKTRDKIVSVQFFENRILIGANTEYSWSHVESLYRIPFTTPIIYRIKFNSSDSALYFSFKYKIDYGEHIHSLEGGDFVNYIQRKTQGKSTLKLM